MKNTVNTEEKELSQDCLLETPPWRNRVLQCIGSRGITNWLNHLSGGEFNPSDHENLMQITHTLNYTFGASKHCTDQSKVLCIWYRPEFHLLHHKFHCRCLCSSYVGINSCCEQSKSSTQKTTCMENPEGQCQSFHKVTSEWTALTNGTAHDRLEGTALHNASNANFFRWPRGLRNAYLRHHHWAETLLLLTNHLVHQLIPVDSLPWDLLVKALVRIQPGFPFGSRHHGSDTSFRSSVLREILLSTGDNTKDWDEHEWHF